LVKDEKGDLLADPHKIFNRWKNYYCRLLNVYGAAGVRHTETRTTEPFVSDCNAFDCNIAMGNLKMYKSPGVDQILAEMFQAGEKILRSEIHKRTKFIRNKEELIYQWKESILYLFTKWVIKLTAVITEAYHWSQLQTNFFKHSSL
jgi:hypothetical protein